MYLAEAKCMLGRYEESLAHLEEAETMTLENKNAEGDVDGK